MTYLLGRLGVIQISAPANPHVGQIVLVFRWTVVLTALTVGVLSGSLTGGPERFAIVGPLAVSAVVTVLSFRPRSYRLLWVVLVADIALGAACVAMTGGVHSAFLFYLSVPLLRLAVHGWVGPLVVGTITALVLLILLQFLEPGGTDELLLGLNEVVVVIVAPWLFHAALQAVQAGGSARGGSLVSRLDADDKHLLLLLATGATYAEVAEELGFSVETIKVRVARLYRRLGAANRTEALARGDMAHAREPAVPLERHPPSA